MNSGAKRSPLRREPRPAGRPAPLTPAERRVLRARRVLPEHAPPASRAARIDLKISPGKEAYPDTPGLSPAAPNCVLSFVRSAVFPSGHSRSFNSMGAFSVPGCRTAGTVLRNHKTPRTQDSARHAVVSKRLLNEFLNLPSALSKRFLGHVSKLIALLLLFSPLKGGCQLFLGTLIFQLTCNDSL